MEESYLKTIRKMLENKLNEIRKLKKIVEKSMKTVPEGTLVVSKSNGRIQFFHKTDKTQKKGKYINKKDNHLVSALAQKEYDSSLYQEISRQEMKIERALKNLPEIELSEIYEKLTEARKPLVNSHIITDEIYAKNWESLKYEGNPFREENKKFETERGELVRSKSEKIIADKLYTMRIPYRYEYPIQIVGRNVIYPDFTLLLVKKRKEVYLEHFGMMDDPEYCERTLLRLQELAKNGIVLGENLYATFESTTVPLDVKVLDFLKKI